MISSDLYCKGAKVWIPDAESVWIGGLITSIFHEKRICSVEKDNGEIIEIRFSDKTGSLDNQLPYLRNPTILIGQKDLTSLSYLNEPEVLYNLQIRFIERKEIYTYCGIVLVAINPYQELPIYGNGIIDAYHSKDFTDLDPHIFAVAENAFRRMSNFNENQSIIVSGESGAGKTVSAKYTMRYFALVGGSTFTQSSNDHSETKIERKVLSSNPVMEAMGNAKTIRNDNSSRFGKYLQINFNRKNQIISANMRTYLLEKSRVVFQNLGERNYHIFYQLVGHSQSGDAVLLNTGLVNNPDNYAYLNSGESLEIDGIDDGEEFIATKNSFLQLGIEEAELRIICEILAAILHLGNIQFSSNESEDGSEIENKELLRLACHQLGCSSDQMEIWLRFRSISTLHETLHKPLTKQEAQYFRDALAKAIYANLFLWIVKKINHSLSDDNYFSKPRNSKKLPSRDQSTAQRFIGVLDIYGFETFDQNSYEQFCINFANEKLQQQFNLHVFKLEQEEYLKEGLEWTIIEYYNNQPCIDLIEERLGLLDLLDEECKMLKGSDENWCCKIYSQHLRKSKHFGKPKMSNEGFIVHHFAGQVQYECNGFIEKNRDTILDEQISLLKASDVPMVAELFANNDYPLNDCSGDVLRSKCSVTQSAKWTQATKLDNSRKMKRTVGHQFRESLKQLMDILNETNPHYIRCIKPNDLKLPFTFCPERAVQQLRACGVLETIRLSATGYPSRWAYNDFFQRYCVLLSQTILRKMDAKQASQMIVRSLIHDEEAFRFGHKKLFFRPGHVAYLEKLRSDKIDQSAILIQKIVRGWIIRQKYVRLLALIIKMQSLIRQRNAVAKATGIRTNRAATKIQSLCRMYVMRVKYNHMTRSAKLILRWWKVQIMTKKEKERKIEGQVIICQSVVRGYFCRKRYLIILRGIILLQSHFRRRKAKIELRSLKVEARSANHIKLINKGLENKIIELTQRLDEKEKEICAITTQTEKEKRLEIEKQKHEKIEKMKAHQAMVQELQCDIVRLKRELSKEILEKKLLYMEKESLDNKYRERILNLEDQVETLDIRIKATEKELSVRNEEIATLKKQSPDAVTLSKEKLIAEQLNYQTLIQDYGKLDIKYQNLCREFQFLTSSNEMTMNTCYTESLASDTESGSTKGDADVESTSDYEDSSLRQAKQSTLLSKKTKDDVVDNISTGGDLAVMMQLQMRVNSISHENNNLRERIQELENKLMESNGSPETQSKSKMTQERLERELYVLMKDIKDKDSNGIVPLLIDQISDLKKQFLQQMEECQTLKTNIFSGRLHKPVANIELEFGDTFSEDGELKLAFESQKEANRKMLKEIEEMRSTESTYKKELVQSKREKEQLQVQMGKQQLIIKRGLGYIIKSQNLKLTPKERLDTFVQNEFSRILSENMRLRETTDKVIAETIQLKRGLKYFAHRLQRYEGPLVPDTNKAEDLLKVVDDVIIRSRIKSEGLTDCHSPVGLIELSLSELPSFIKAYIHDLNPNLFSQLEVYHTPVFVMFMVARKYDAFREEENIVKFLTKVISALRSIIRKNKHNFDFLAMWMSHVFCLLNLFRQYNGTNQFCQGNNEVDNRHRFIVFDLSEFIRLLSDLCITIYQLIMTYIRENLLPQSLCIDAILLYEGIKTSLSKEAVLDMQHLETQPRNTSFNILIKHLQSILDTMKNHKVSCSITNQIFLHISYLINAHCLNNLLFRADLCYFSKGIQIKFNLSNLETWFRNQNLEDSGSMQCLQPMIEAVQLLQTLLKSDDDAQMICDMCEYLNSSQIIKLLHNFNPRDGWGCQLPSGLIGNIEEILTSKESGRQHSSNVETATIIPIPIDIPYVHNPQSLNDIVIPRIMYLPCMKILTEHDLA